MSGAALDMTLDDLIKQNKKPSGGGGGRGRGRGSGPGPSRRFNNRAANRTTPYGAPKAPDSVWTHDMFSSDQAMAYASQLGVGGGGRASAIETGTKLYISNLDYGVSNEDIKELFSEVGDLKRSTIHYDRSGRSKGTAEIVFSRRQDAAAAVKRYNGVQLDGKPMQIEIVGTNIVTPAAGPQFPGGAFGDSNGIPRSGQGRGGSFGRPRGGGGRGRGFGRGRGRGRGRGEKISAEALDAELENYHKESMEDN
ncbi:THO complex subunit 4A [Coffea eugenioides]|uniref:THO complex subunit 4A n=1 Tax=Coffea arabica TaxID=13443 RepID=A0A6P6UAL2_COFAR|nr:THO complex subunit 4A [Coffea arabica]XP_027180308.1 THO complex subunit 4A [Coffea eugenioides]